MFGAQEIPVLVVGFFLWFAIISTTLETVSTPSVIAPTTVPTGPGKWGTITFLTKGNALPLTHFQALLNPPLTLVHTFFQLTLSTGATAIIA